MLLSRGATLLKSVHRVSAVKPTTLNSAQIRNVWCYRRVPPPDRVWITLTELAGGIMWWWVLWHLWHDFDHIIGHFPYPKPYEWTDEELGIPPDEEL